MSWSIHPERLCVVEDDAGKFATEVEALEALVEQLHAMRDQHRAILAPNARLHEQRTAQHRVNQLKERIVSARRRQRTLGQDVPLAWREGVDHGITQRKPS